MRLRRRLGRPVLEGIEGEGWTRPDQSLPVYESTSIILQIPKKCSRLEVFVNTDKLDRGNKVANSAWMKDRRAVSTFILIQNVYIFQTVGDIFMIF